MLVSAYGQTDGRTLMDNNACRIIKRAWIIVPVPFVINLLSKSFSFWESSFQKLSKCSYFSFKLVRERHTKMTKLGIDNSTKKTNNNNNSSSNNNSNIKTKTTAATTTKATIITRTTTTNNNRNRNINTYNKRFTKRGHLYIRQCMGSHTYKLYLTI